MQHHQEIEKHHTGFGFLLFGGLTAALGWTLYIVWVGLVNVANQMR